MFPTSSGCYAERSSLTIKHINGVCLGGRTIIGHTGRQLVRGTIALGCDGEAELALNTVLSGLGDAVDIAVVGGDSDVACCLTRVPLP